MPHVVARTAALRLAGLGDKVQAASLPALDWLIDPRTSSPATTWFPLLKGPVQFCQCTTICIILEDQVAETCW